MVTLESLIWKISKDLDRLLTYRISKGIDWKSMPHRDIMFRYFIPNVNWPL
jgi:hypothetical protein